VSIVGIDLGTTNSLVAHLRDGRPELIPNRNGQRMTPSVVGLDRTGKLLVGEAARAQLTTAPERTVAEAKRLMGTGERLRLGDRTYTPQEISGLVLRALKEDAERHLGSPVEEAVITVPAYFTDAQRQATKDAGELAGFQVERILNEPTAAALAYGLDRLEEESLVVVYDLGGGTFDVSVLELFKGVLDVKASAGNNRLGGGDFDRLLAGWLARELAREHGVDLSGDRVAMARLVAAAEQAKTQLSSAEVTAISLPFLFAKNGAPVSPELELTRAKLEELLLDLVRSTLDPVEKALQDARVAGRDVDAVVLVGGSSRMPLVQRVVAERFGQEPRRGVHPDEAVAAGAAIQAGLKSGALSARTGIMIADICPYTLGVEASSRVGAQLVDGLFSPIIRRNSTIPVSRSEIYSTTGDGQTVVKVRVFQGDDKLVKNDAFLDEYEVAGIPPGPAGSERVAITFTYDVNGILHVKTKIVTTGKEAVLRVDRSAQRMTGPEREEARARLEAEWSAPAAAAPAGLAPAPSPATAPDPTAPGAPAAGTGHSAPPDELRQLAAAARARSAEAPPAVKAGLLRLAGELERALAAGDLPAAARAGDELTELLFELG
jgi:molecular chaperone DnaK